MKLVSNSIIHHQTVESKRAPRGEGWDPDTIAYTFTAWGKCGNTSCKQDFAIAGRGGLEPAMDEDGNYSDWEESFYPLICHPMPEIVAFPNKCPDEVNEELRAAFALFWSNRAACAGRVRVALECLMNHLGVPKRKKDKHGKLYELKLHARIDLFAKNEPAVGPCSAAARREPDIRYILRHGCVHAI